MWQNCPGVVLGALALSLFALGVDGAEPVKFERDVAPILVHHCVRCHRPESKKGDVSLITAADVQASEVVVPGQPEESTLLQVVGSSVQGGKPRMPKEGPALSVEQVTVLGRWVEQGARWPEGMVLKEAPKAAADWWSLRPLGRIDPPRAEGWPAGQSGNPIDAFIAAGLKEKGLEPSPPASRRTLIRRLSYDLTGLPPTPAEIAAFEADSSPLAYEALVDRLLASPHYGEQWGRHWLD